MKKRVSPLILAALVLAACGGGGSGAVAATVNDEEITVGDIEALIGSDEVSTIPKETFAQILGFQIQWRVVSEAAEEEFGIVISDQEITAEADEIFEANRQGDESREDFLATNSVTEDFLRNVAHQQLLDAQVRDALAAEVEEPTQEQIDDVITAAEALYCTSHILVESEAEANDVADRIEAGEQFADLAVEVSTDGSAAQGGDLGCISTDSLVPEFVDALTTAELDVPTEPVESEFGFHIILLRADEIPTEDEIAEQLQAGAIGAQTNSWFLDQIEASEITVEERYGTWQASPPQVLPPTDTE